MPQGIDHPATLAATRRRLVLALLGATPLAGLARSAPAAAPPATALWRAVQAARHVAEGDAGPWVHVFFDPRCHACATLYAGTRAHLRHGRLRLAWLPVALLGAPSLRQGAALLAAADPVHALAQSLQRGEPRFALRRAPLYADVLANLELLRMLAGAGAATPAVLYAGDAGRPQSTPFLAPVPLSAWRYPP